MLKEFPKPYPRPKNIKAYRFEGAPHYWPARLVKLLIWPERLHISDRPWLFLMLLPHYALSSLIRACTLSSFLVLIGDELRWRFQCCCCVQQYVQTTTARGDHLHLTAPDRHASGNKRWPCNELREKMMKAAASFQVFRTVFCTAIIIQQVQKIQKIRKTYWHFQKIWKENHCFSRPRKWITLVTMLSVTELLIHVIGLEKQWYSIQVIWKCKCIFLIFWNICICWMIIAVQKAVLDTWELAAAFPLFSSIS
jgi:hypothetical protein